MRICRVDPVALVVCIGLSIIFLASIVSGWHGAMILHGIGMSIILMSSDRIGKC